MNEPQPLESFDPEYTGRRLPKALLPVWVKFCGAVYAASPEAYNTWFENRHGRDRGWGTGKNPMQDWRVRAESRDGQTIQVYCPGKNGLWAEKFTRLFYGELRDIERPEMYVTAMR